MDLIDFMDTPKMWLCSDLKKKAGHFDGAMLDAETGLFLDIFRIKGSVC
jgi:hypothetical protein